MELKTGCISIHTNLLRLCQLYILSIWVILRRGMAYPRSNHLLLLEVAAKPWTLTMGHNKLLAQTSYEAIFLVRMARLRHGGALNEMLMLRTMAMQTQDYRCGWSHQDSSSADQECRPVAVEMWTDGGRCTREQQMWCCECLCCWRGHRPAGRKLNSRVRCGRNLYLWNTSRSHAAAQLLPAPARWVCSVIAGF